MEEKKCEHDLEVKQLKEEVGRGNRDRKSLEEKVKRERQYKEQLRKKKQVGV